MVAVWLIIILAVVQGILEWLPVSSEGWVVLILNWFGETENSLAIALFLHLGTMIAVIIRFRKDFALLFDFKLRGKKQQNEVIKEIPEENEEEITLQNKKQEQRILWKFILLATLATAIVGLPIFVLLKILLQDESILSFAGGAISTGDIITMVIGLLLIGTGIFILFSRKRTTHKPLLEMKNWEMFVVGAVQGITIFPGVSRSGSTVGALLIEGVNEEDALKGSFLLSVPAVLGINIINLIFDLIQGDFSFEGIPWYGLVLAFLISGGLGYLTIDLFLKLARKINFGWFCITVGSIAIIITLIVIILALTTAT